MTDFKTFYYTIPKKEKIIINALSKYSEEVYVVGGAVRDFIVGIKPNDYDIATNLHPEEIKHILSKELPASKIDEVGKSFGIIICDGIEIATFRGDHYAKNGNNKDVNITFCETITEDLARRDLTISALAYNVSKNDGKIVDPFNGRNHINQNLISFVGDPFERIKEDPNRMIRVARFAAKMNAVLSFETERAIRESIHLFQYIAKERISKEILKAMKIKKASWFFTVLLDCGLLKDIFPTLDRCVFHDGGPHHKEDLFQHMMIAGDFISTRCPVLKLSGYLHDIGKYHVYDKVERTFIGHEYVGEKIVRKELKDLKFSNEIIDKIAAYVKLHMRNNTHGGEKSVRKMIRAFQEHGINYRAHTRLKLADRAGNLNKPNFKFGEIKNILLTYEELFTTKEDSVFSIKDLKVNGNDLIERFNLRPGRIVGDALRFTLEAVYDKYLINDKEEILYYLSENFNFGG
jgi:tRNA nucleotidyltransferase/poly(A) polymerase